MCFICCNGLYSTAQYTVAIPAPSQIWVRCARPAPVSTLRHKFYFKFSDLKPVSFQPLIRHQQLQIGSGSELGLIPIKLSLCSDHTWLSWHLHVTHVTCHDDMSPSPTCDTMTSFPPAPLLPRPEMGLSGMPGVSGYPPHPPPFHPGSFSPGHFPGLGPTNSFSTPSGGWRPTNSHKGELSQSSHFRIPRTVSKIARFPFWARARFPASASWGGQRQGWPQGDAGAQGALDRVPQERDWDGDHQVRPVSVVMCVTVTRWIS